MASVFNTVIGAVRVEASMESGKFVDGAKKIRTEASKTEAHLKKTTTGMSTAMGALKAGIAGFVGALSVGLVTQAIQRSLQYASSLKDVSQQLGVTTRDLQTLRFAATQTGVTQQALDTGLQNLTKTLGQLAAGAERPRKAFAAIGLTVKDLAGLDTGQAFRKIADGLKNVEDRSQRAAIEYAIFQEVGSKLDTMLAGGSERLNELARAADELGIVLSDEQIQKADETANKLDALKTVISARIAGAVADNADAILDLANAIANLVGEIPNAINQIRAFYAEVTRLQLNWQRGVQSVIDNPVNRFNPLTQAFGALTSNRRRQTIGILEDRLSGLNNDFLRGRFGAARGGRPVPPAPRAGGTIDPFLAPRGRRGGGGGGRARRAPRDRSDDVEFQFAQEVRRANMDVLRAKQQLARDEATRAELALAMLDLEREQHQAELDNRVRRAERDFAEGKITEGALEQVRAQADVLSAKYDEVDALKRNALAAEQMQQQFEDNVELTQHEFQLQQEVLDAQLALATTAEERRALELQLLDIAYRQERARLRAVLAEESMASDLEKQQALMDLNTLDARFAGRRAVVMRNTMNPLEAWAASVPQTAAEINEALQSISTHGLDGIADAITDIITGSKNMAEAFGDVARSIIADIIQMTIRMLIFRAIAGIFGAPAGGGLTGQAAFNASASAPGFASGGSFSIFGPKGVDKIPLTAGGVHIANVSHGERISVANDAAGGPIEVQVIVDASPDLMVKAAVVADSRIAAARPVIVREARGNAIRSLTRQRLP